MTACGDEEVTGTLGVVVLSIFDAETPVQLLLPNTDVLVIVSGLVVVLTVTPSDGIVLNLVVISVMVCF